MWNPENLAECLEEVYCRSGNTRERQLTAMCWGLVYAYRALFCKEQKKMSLDLMAKQQTTQLVNPKHSSSPNSSNKHSSYSNPDNRHCSHSNPSDRRCS